MPTGTSIRGFQVIQSLAERTWNQLYADVGDKLAPTPTRVGFIYVFLEVQTPAIARPLIYYAPVYEPGIYNVLSIPPSSDGDTLSCLVNWNYAGIPWSIDLYSA